METLPKKINVTYVLTYDVNEMVKQLREDNRDINGELEVTLDDVIEAVIMAWRDGVAEAKGRDLTITDEQGEEL